ncbi:MAG: hypothetical protein KAR47_01170 [Planctomycetes bacterium]|nr:hypothetical protein [Planctomycetota bacterium]
MNRKGSSFWFVLSTLMFAAVIAYAWWAGLKYNNSRIRIEALEDEKKAVSEQLDRQEQEADDRIEDMQGRIDELKSELTARARTELQLKKDMEKLARKVAAQAKAQVPVAAEPEPVRGLVTSILYSDRNSSAVIDRQILREGQSIYGVEVVGISRNEVAFSRDSMTWKQRINQTPNSAWTE